MKATCPISGISYILSKPVRGHAIHPHPMLSSSIKVSQLNEWYLQDWIAGDLPEVETHLLGLAYLLKLPVESISLAVSGSESEFLEVTDKFWSGILEKLAKLATRLDGKVVSMRRLPKMVVNNETLRYIPDWLDTLSSELGAASMPISDKAKELNRSSYKVSSEVSGRTISQYLEPSEIDGIVLRALRNSPLASSEAKALPVILADWALKVTDFPAHSRTRWQRVIQTIFQEDFVNKILMSDITLEQVKAIEEHMQLNTPEHAVGTSHSSLLMQRLATVIPVLEDFAPAISSRKKVNEQALNDALMGGVGSGIGATKPDAPTGPKMTLAERLAARMSKIAAGGSN